MVKLRSALVVSVLASASPLAGQCRLCAPTDEAVRATPSRPLTITVETALDLGRAAQGRGGGSIALDERGGTRRVAGLIDLGGAALSGRVRIAGEPFAHVRVSLPATMRLTAPDGSVAEITGVRADISPDAVLDAGGILEFGFGGTLAVPPGVAGELRGRIAITADYQ